jgi:hypothetical protein
MTLSIEDNSKNYACVVVEIDKLFPIENSDNIQRAYVLGNSVVVAKTVKLGDVMLYFCSGTQLNAEYCKINNLYDKSEMNADIEKRGFISHRQRRVKAIKLRGVISDGLLMPVDSLVGLINADTAKQFKVGDEFTTINGNILCEKYIVQVSTPTGKTSNKDKNKITRFDRLIENQFEFHNDTENLRRNMHNIYPDSFITINYKKHGTSAVFANIPTKRPLKWYEKILTKLGVSINDIEYDVVYSSRKVVKNKYINEKANENSFYSQDIWGIVCNEISHLIPKNWTLYGEIVGYLPGGQAIQGKYDYGCKPGEHKFFVYKISVVNPDGKRIYLSDTQIAEWCDLVGINFSETFLFHGKAKSLYPQLYTEDLDLWREKFLQELEDNYNEKNCYMCINKVPEEGVVLRVESVNRYEAYKLKSKRFILMESDEQEKGTSNIEDSN